MKHKLVWLSGLVLLLSIGCGAQAAEVVTTTKEMPKQAMVLAHYTGYYHRHYYRNYPRHRYYPRYYRRHYYPRYHRRYYYPRHYYRHYYRPCYHCYRRW